MSSPEAFFTMKVFRLFIISPLRIDELLYITRILSHHLKTGSLIISRNSLYKNLLALKRLIPMTFHEIYQVG